MEVLDCIEFLDLVEGRVFVVYYQICLELFLVRFNEDIFRLATFLQFIKYSTCVIVAFKGPRIRIFRGFEQSYSSSSLFGYMVIDIFIIHVLFCKVAALVLKDLTIHWQYFRKEADFHLFVKFICWVTINKHSFVGCMRVQI